MTREGPSAVIAVSDTGPGLDPEFLPFVFERFRQADTTTTRPHGGLGLGLAIVRHLAEAHGGTVSVSSGREGRGAVFRVQLPLRSVVHVTPPALPPAAAPYATLDGVRTALLSDDPESTDLLRAMLESYGAVVVHSGATNATPASAGEPPADLLVADFGDRMEEALALIRRVRAVDERAGRPAAVLVTAYATAKDRAQSREAGFDLHFAKPLDPDQLVGAAAALLGSRS